MKFKKQFNAASLVKTRQSGFTLVELMIVLVIGGIIAVAGSVLYSSSSQSATNTTLYKDIEALYAAGGTFKSAGGAYVGVSVANAVADGVLDDRFGDGTGANPHQGNYVMTAIAGNRLQITASELTTKSCGSVSRRLAQIAVSAVCATSTLTVVFN